MSNAGERAVRAEQQRRRRMSRRSCRCGRRAEFILDWQGQSVPACMPCKKKLEDAEQFVYLCAFDEVSASLLRPVSQCPAAPGDVVQGPDERDGAEEQAGEEPHRSFLQNVRGLILGS